MMNNRDELVKAIGEGNVRAVKKLLPHVDVNQRNAIRNSKPFWFEQMLLIDRKDGDPREHNRIFEELMDGAKDVPASLAEDPLALFGLRNNGLAATAVLTALCQLNHENQHFLSDIFSEKSLKTVTSEKFRDELKQSMVLVLDHVRGRLALEISPIDNEAAKASRRLGIDEFFHTPLPFDAAVRAKMMFRPRSPVSPAVESPTSSESSSFQGPVMRATLEDVTPLGRELRVTEVEVGKSPTSIWVQEDRKLTRRALSKRVRLDDFNIK